MKELILLSLFIVGCQDHFVSSSTFNKGQATCENHGGLMGIQTQKDTCYLMIICNDKMVARFDNCAEDRLYLPR